MTARRGPPPFLLDTHIWFWYLVGSERLAEGLREAIDQHRDALWLSPVSVWELGLLHERGRIRFSDDVRRWVDDALQELPVNEAPLTRETALTSLEVDLAHRDPADRFLVATAKVYGLTLMTLDQRLSSIKGVTTRSS